ncbi:MAG: C25 family cysteine peptidase [Thermodesulfobacteriota bacterium]|nr:C25 family cysteine peptidase [Thermodesulfobacteriota bacterium]
MPKSTRVIAVIAILLAVTFFGIQSGIAQDPEWIDFSQGLEGDISYVEVAASSATSLMLKVALPGMYTYPIEMADEEIYTAVSVPGSEQFETGKPAVPVFSEWILIPNGADVEIGIDPGEPLLYEDMYLPPGQPLSGDCEGELILPFAKDEETYGMDTDCPGDFVTLEQRQTLRGQECAIIWLYPYQHNPVTRTLSVYPDLSVTLLFQEGWAAIPPEERSAAFEDIMRRMAVNADAVLPEEVPPEEYDTGPYGWDYIIIISDTKFEPAADKLAAWKKKLGFKALVHKVPATWDELAIKTALEGAYKNWKRKPKYVLIIGDAEYVPCHYASWHVHNFERALRCECSGCWPEPKNTQHYVATDLYYATMDGPNDLAPEMFMGRLSVDTASQAMKRVDDIIKYEKNPVMDPTFYNHVAVAAEFEDNDIEVSYGIPNCKRNTYEDKRFVQTSEDTALFLGHPSFNIGKSVDRIYNADSAVTPTYWCNSPDNFGGGPAGNPGTKIPTYLLRSNGFAWNGSGLHIANALNSGRFLLTYRGHGARDFWRTPKFDAQTFQSLNNGDKLPVIWSLSCQTGWFDNETDFFWSLRDKNPSDYTDVNMLCFSEQWERRPNGGAIGIVAGTRVTFGFLNEHLSWGMLDAIWPSFNASKQPVYSNIPILRMGEVLYYGRQYMMKAKISSTDAAKKKKANYEAYHWFGDPAMEIRTKRPPQIMVAQVPPIWPWALYPRNFTVHVLLDDGDEYQGPVEKAKVTISKQDSPSDYWMGKTDEEGYVTFPGLVTSTLGEYDVVVTASNTIPYAGTFESQAGPGGILLDAEVYPCPSEIGIKVAHADWAGLGPIAQVVETSGGDEETVTLIEAPAGLGMFVGTIPADSGVALPGDGILQVSDGETILVAYGGQEDTALVDCQPPAFDGLVAATRNNRRGCVELEWNAAYDDYGPVTYNIYRYDAGSSIGILIGSTWALSFPDCDIDPGGMYRYLVRAQDASGNEDNNTVQATPPDVRVSVAKVRWRGPRSSTGRVHLKADLETPVPEPDEQIALFFDGISLFDVPFSLFRQSRDNPNVYRLFARDFTVKLDFEEMTLKVFRRRLNLSSLDNSNGVDVELYVGDNAAVENIAMVPGRGRSLRYVRPD